MNTGFSPIQIKMPAPPSYLYPAKVKNGIEVRDNFRPKSFDLKQTPWSQYFPLQTFPHQFQFWRDAKGVPHQLLTMTQEQVVEALKQKVISINHMKGLPGTHASWEELQAFGIRPSDLATLFLMDLKPIVYQHFLGLLPLFSAFLKMVVKTCPNRPLVFSEVGYGSLLHHLLAALNNPNIDQVFGVEEPNVTACAQDLFKKNAAGLQRHLHFCVYDIPESDILLCVGPRPSDTDQLVLEMSKKVRPGGSLIVVPDGVYPQTFRPFDSPEWTLVMEWATTGQKNDVFCSHHVSYYETMLWWRRKDHLKFTVNPSSSL